MNDNLKKFIPHLISLAIILAVSMFYFLPQMSGKVMKQGDLVQVGGMAKEIVDYNKKGEGPALWTNSMFGGMPSYQINTPSGKVMGYVYKTLTLGFNRPIGVFILGMIMFYITMLILGINHWLALIGSLFFGFTTNSLILFEAGHSSKLNVIMFSPGIIGGLILTYRKNYLFGAALFTISLALNVHSNHIQMSYYLALCLVILVITYFISAVMKKDVLSFFKSSGILLICSILALAASAGRLWTTYEYAEDTMRGKPILEAKAGQEKSSSTVEGLDYDYATQWSNGIGDLFASFIPRVVGGGSTEKVGKNSPFAKAVGSRKTVLAPTYFGSLPFTSGPIYFGAIVFFLFVFGAFAASGRMKWFIVISVVATLLLSMGKNFDPIHRLIYDLVPLYNKFRTPNSILSITSVLIPMLAILVLSQLTKSENKEKYLMPLYISTGLLGGICLILWLMGGNFFDFALESDKQYGEIASILEEQRSSMMATSCMTSLFLILLTAGVLFFYIKSKISNKILLLVIGLFGIGDLINVGLRYVSHDDFIGKKNSEKEYEPRMVDNQILQDKDPYYRVYDASVNTFNNAMTSYHHKTIGGYHAAKLQRYQDIIDNHISKNNMKVLDMLNTKYFIVPTGQDKPPMVQQNPGALGNAWFIKNAIIVENANAEIDSLNSFDPKIDAVVHKEFSDYVKGIAAADSSSNIKLTSYSPVKLEYDANVSNGNQLAVFSDIWYGPNKGWTASIDGVQTEFIRANYLLRALKIPAGKHKITFEFKPKSYFNGEKISMIASLIVILLAIFAAYKSFKKPAMA